MKTKLSRLRHFFYPLLVIGVVYTLYLCIQFLFLFLGRLLSPLLKIAWKLEELTAGVVLPNFILHLFLGLIPLLIAFYLAEKTFFRHRFLPRFFPPSPWAHWDLLFGLALGFFFCPVIPGFSRWGGSVSRPPACGVARSLLDGSNLYGGGPF